jgi:hypothetical protein
LRIIYTKTNTKIVNSYLLKTKTEINKIVMKILSERESKNLPITRNFESYVREIKAHNRLYNLGLFRSHTKDTDLNENQSKFMEIIFTILSI